MILSVLTLSIFVSETQFWHVSLRSIQTITPFEQCLSLETSLSVNKRGIFSPHLYGHSAIHCVDRCLPLTASCFPGSYDHTVFLLFSHLAGSSFFIVVAGSSQLPRYWVSEFLKASTLPIPPLTAYLISRHLCFRFNYLCRCQ